MRNAHKKDKSKSYFRTEYLYAYSLAIAGLDSFLFSNSDPKPFSFETYCMRALCIFTFWLIIKMLTDKVAKKGYSYTIVATMISLGVTLILISLAFLVVLI